jgi:hypothetical protein
MALTRNLGSSIGQALAGAVWSIVTLAAASAVAAGVSTATQAPPDAMMAGIRTVFGLSVVFSIAAGLTSVFGRGTPPVAHGQHAPASPGAVPAPAQSR